MSVSNCKRIHEIIYIQNEFTYLDSKIRNVSRFKMSVRYIVILEDSDPYEGLVRSRTVKQTSKLTHPIFSGRC